MHDSRLRGLYAITSSQMENESDLAVLVELALKGGARIVQYRDKSNGHEKRLQEAGKLLDLCRRHSALFIINDDVKLAAEIGADGVHLGRDDPDVASAREQLGDTAIIGVSCYNQIDLASHAQEMGVDYVAFGRFFPSHTKPDAVQANPDLLCEAKQALQIPVVAIGGITSENGASLIAAGADMLAVIQGLFGQRDIRATAEQFKQLFAQNEDSDS